MASVVSNCVDLTTPALVALYGCHGHAPRCKTVYVQDGWTQYPDLAGRWSRIPVLKTIPNTASTECRYDRAHKDPRCSGCEHMPKMESPVS